MYCTNSICILLYLFVECGGKMHLREGEYEPAHTDFFEAFKNYDEAGSPRCARVLECMYIHGLLYCTVQCGTLQCSAVHFAMHFSLKKESMKMLYLDSSTFADLVYLCALVLSFS